MHHNITGSLECLRRMFFNVLLQASSEPVICILHSAFFTSSCAKCKIGIQMAHPYISYVLTKSTSHAAFTLGFHIICCIIERSHFVTIEFLNIFRLL